MTSDDHLQCAATVSAYSYLVAQGRIPEQELASDPLVAAMTHLNAYAIPQNIDEKAAFAALNRIRDDLLASGDPGDIAERAKTCVEQAPRG